MYLVVYQTTTVKSFQYLIIIASPPLLAKVSTYMVSLPRILGKCYQNRIVQKEMGGSGGEISVSLYCSLSKKLWACSPSPIIIGPRTAGSAAPSGPRRRAGKGNHNVFYSKKTGDFKLYPEMIFFFSLFLSLLVADNSETKRIRGGEARAPLNFLSWYDSCTWFVRVRVFQWRKKNGLKKGTTSVVGWWFCLERVTATGMFFFLAFWVCLQMNHVLVLHEWCVCADIKNETSHIISACTEVGMQMQMQM